MTLDAALFSPRPHPARRSRPTSTDLDPNSPLRFLSALSACPERSRRVSALASLPALSSLFLATICERYILSARCVQERSASPLFSITSALYTKTPGCHQEGFSHPLANLDSPLTSLDATLTGDLRVGFQGLYLQTLSQQKTEISRNWPPASPLDATLTRARAVTPLEATLTKTRGEGVGRATGTRSVLSSTSLRRSTALNWSAYVHQTNHRQIHSRPR